MTVLQGDICHRTSTPHKIGNTLKRKEGRLTMSRAEVRLRYILHENRFLQNDQATVRFLPSQQQHVAE